MSYKILLYHEVTDFPERGKKIRKMSPADSLPTKQFEEQMVYLSGRPDTAVVAVDDLFVEAQDRVRRVVLTFDDGCVGNYLFASLILKRYGYQATFFVTVDHISKNGFMNWNQLNSLYKDGHSIQSHTMTHPMLGECDESRIAYELEASKKVIEDRIGSPVKYLSLPFGSFNEKVASLALRLGYQAIFTSLSVGEGTRELRQLGRIHIKDTYSLKKFMGLMDPNPAQYFVTRAGEVLKGTIKQIIGLDNYRKLYRRVHRIDLKLENHEHTVSID